MIWPKQVTLISSTQTSGPLCLWQCLCTEYPCFISCWFIIPDPEMHVRNFTLKTFTLSFCMFLFYFFLICARDVKKANGFWTELGNNQVDTNGPGTWLWFWILGSTAILHIKSSLQNVPKLTKMIPKVSKIMHLGHIFFSGPRQTSFLHCLPTWVKFPIWTGTWVLQYSIPSTRIRMGILTKQKVESSSITRLMIINSKKNN